MKMILKTILDTIPWLLVLVVGWAIYGMGDVHAHDSRSYLGDPSRGSGEVWAVVGSLVVFTIVILFSLAGDRIAMGRRPVQKKGQTEKD